LPQTLTRRLIKQKARHHPRRGSDTLSAHGFRIYFTPLTAVLFTFPSRYLFTIGRQRVFSLTPWSAWIHAAFHVCRVTQELPRGARAVGYGSLTLWGAGFHPLHLAVALSRWGPTTPGEIPPVWALPLSFATTDGIDSLSFPPVTEMFHFTGYGLPASILFKAGDGGISPHGLPHSEIPGSKRLCRFPGLIAA